MCFCSSTETSYNTYSVKGFEKNDIIPQTFKISKFSRPLSIPPKLGEMSKLVETLSAIIFNMIEGCTKIKPWFFLWMNPYTRSDRSLNIMDVSPKVNYNWYKRKCLLKIGFYFQTFLVLWNHLGFKDSE